MRSSSRFDFVWYYLRRKRLHNAYISISSVVTLYKCPLTEGPVSSPQNGHQDTRSWSGTLLSSTACSRTSAMICSSHLEQKYTDYWWYLVHFRYYYQIALVSGFNLESCVMWNHSLHMNIHIIMFTCITIGTLRTLLKMCINHMAMKRKKEKWKEKPWQTHSGSNGCHVVNV